MIKSKAPTPAMEAFRSDLLVLLNKYAGALDASEMMALGAYTTGQIMAMQDARKWSAAQAMEVVAKNLEEGNAQAITDAHKWMGQA